MRGPTPLIDDYYTTGRCELCARVQHRREGDKTQRANYEGEAEAGGEAALRGVQIRVRVPLRHALRLRDMLLRDKIKSFKKTQKCHLMCTLGRGILVVVVLVVVE